jgi:5-methylcytosine-specific restriction endonuclease McrA
VSRLSDGRPDPRSTPQWQRLRVECFERDRARNAPCHLCGQAIDYRLKPSSSPDAYEADHIRDVDTRPELALLPENVAASHRRCNRARGKKAGIDNLGNRSRDWRLGKVIQ